MNLGPEQQRAVAKGVSPSASGRAFGALMLAVLAALLTACATRPPAPETPQLAPAEAKSLIARLIPPATADRVGWASDIYAAMSVQRVEPSRDNACAVVAVIEQESSFRIDPVVAGLPKIAWSEIDRRAEQAGVPKLLVHAALQLGSPDGRSYSDRIDSVRTERELSEVFEDFIGMVPMGKRLFGSANPIRTRGPMQVNVAFAKRYVADHAYPYPAPKGIDEELFARRGSIFFGVAHLLDYPARYDKPLYRFADFNAGQYASRNAAFQQALASATGLPVTTDGALLPRDEAAPPGSTELAARVVAARAGIGDGAVRRALEQGGRAEFDNTPLYRRVFEVAERNEGHAFPRALVPTIDLQSPKITRHLTTAWYAAQVDRRYQRCLAH
ncbi:MAG: DUF1615 domain-containing protein [Caldimonas sp.]